MAEMDNLDGLDSDDEKFFHPYMAPQRMENTVIDFDIQNLQKLLVENNKKIPVEKIANRVREHYLDSSRLIKRAYGKKIEDDFQLYNWGLTLTMDMGLATDKLELLLNVYAKKLPRRITLPDFERIIKDHSSWRKIRDRRDKGAKYLDLMASYKMHIVKKDGYPDTIGKRQFHTILDVTEIDLDLDVVRITRDIKRADKYSNKLHMLLLDDPLIKGDFNAEIGQMLQDENPEESERLRDFEARVAAEEEQFGPLEQADVDERMRKAYQDKEDLEEKRRLARIEKEAKRLALRKADEEAKQAKLDRLAEIKADREAHELRKELEKQRLEKEAREARERTEREEIMRQEEEYQNAELRAITEAVREEEARKAEQLAAEEEKIAAASRFSHLSGEERIRAEAAYRLSEHRRLKDLERRRLLEETRKYADSQLALRTARELGRTGMKPQADLSKLARAGDLDDASTDVDPNTTASSSKKSGAKRKIQKSDGQARKAKKEEVLASEDALEKLKRIGSERAGSAAKNVKRGERPPSPTSTSVDNSGDTPKTAGSARQRRVESERLRREEEELLRVERNRAKLRADEEARIQHIEKTAKLKEDRELERFGRRQKEEEERIHRLEEQLRVKAEREERIAESRALRKLEDERLAARQNQPGQNQKEAAKSVSSAQVDEGRVFAKRKANADAKRETARKRVEALRTEQEAKRQLMNDVLLKKASKEKEKKMKPKQLRKKVDVANFVDTPGNNSPSVDVERAADEEMQTGENSLEPSGIDMDVTTCVDDAGGNDYISEKDLDMLFPSNAALDESLDIAVDDLDSSTEKGESIGTDAVLAPVVDDSLVDTEKPNDGDDQYIFSETGDISEVVALKPHDTDTLVTAAELSAPAVEAALDNDSINEPMLVEKFSDADGGLLLQQDLCAAASQAQEVKDLQAKEVTETDSVEINAEIGTPRDAHIQAQAQSDVQAEVQAGAEAEDQYNTEADDKALAKAKAEEEARANAIAQAKAEIDAQARAEVEAQAKAEADAHAEAEARARADEEARAKAEAEARAMAEEEERIRAEAEARYKAEEEAQAKARALAQLGAEAQAKAEEESFAAQAQVDAHVDADAGVNPESEGAKSQADLEAESQADADAEVEVDVSVGDEVEAHPSEIAEAGAHVPEDGLTQDESGTELVVEDASAVDLAEQAFSQAIDEKAFQEEQRRIDVGDPENVSVLTEGVVESPSGTPRSATGSVSSRHSSQSSLVSLPAFEVTGHTSFSRPTDALNIDEIRRMPAYDVHLLVPQSADGTLRLNLREDSDGEHRGIFFHGFKKGSAAAMLPEQDKLQVNDEIVKISGTSVEGGSLQDVIAALKGRSAAIDAGAVEIVARRHHVNMGKILYEGGIPDEEINDGPLSPEHLAGLGLPSSLRMLRDMPAHVIQVDVPKSEDGTLRLAWRSAFEEGLDHEALVLHEFLPDSAAAVQGSLRAGDELLAANDYDMEGGTASELNHVLSQPESLTLPHVTLRVRRHAAELAEQILKKQELDVDEYLAQAPVFSIMDGVVIRPDIPSLDELREAPSEELDVLVPKSNDGTLRINLRHDDEGDSHGLFIHGFKPNSAAEAQGLVFVGDELLCLNGVDVEGQFLSAIVAILQNHSDDVVSMRLRRHKLGNDLHLRFNFSDMDGDVVHSARRQIRSARMETSPRASLPPTPQLTARSEHEVFQIHDQVQRKNESTLAELSLFPAVDIDLMVPKSKDGSLRIYIRHDDEGDAHGLFVHGFKLNSAAEKQGLLKTGDELITVDGTFLKGGYLEDVVTALQHHAGPLVKLTIRRHLLEEHDALLDEMVSHEFEAERRAMAAEMEEKATLQAENDQRALEAAMAEMEAEVNQGQDQSEDDVEEAAKKAARKSQLDKLIREQKRQRQMRMEKEAEERSKRARSMPNSLLTEKALAMAEKSKPWTDFDVAVPKTNGELRLHVKHSHKKGLFIHGFKPGSLAESQGILRQGDELISVEENDVHGKSLQVLVGILKTHTSDFVNAKFRRHKYKM